MVPRNPGQDIAELQTKVHGKERNKAGRDRGEDSKAPDVKEKVNQLDLNSGPFAHQKTVLPTIGTTSKGTQMASLLVSYNCI